MTDDFPETFFRAVVPFFERLNSIYSAIDTRYQEAADHYGFSCSGCDDNCCRTHFYHHTHIEYLYIRQGFKSLSDDLQEDVLMRAGETRDRMQNAGNTADAFRLMCPLNIKGKCSLYEYRPMICRMHGIPHELNKPGLPASYGQGCKLFMEKWGDKAYVPFDRTPFYFEMARLENDVKEKCNLQNKFKKTIAQMLVK